MKRLISGSDGIVDGIIIGVMLSSIVMTVARVDSLFYGLPEPNKEEME